MITKMTITNVNVIDQESAYDFYVNKICSTHWLE